MWFNIGRDGKHKAGIAMHRRGVCAALPCSRPDFLF